MSQSNGVPEATSRASSLVEAPDLGTVAARGHRAPAATLAPAGIEEQPAASVRGAFANARPQVRGQQVGGGQDDRPQHAVDTTGLLGPDPHAGAAPHRDAPLPQGRTEERVQPPEIAIRRTAAVRNRQEQPRDQFSQASGPTQATLRPPSVEPRGRRDGGPFHRAREAGLSCPGAEILDVADEIAAPGRIGAPVDGVDEVERHVPGDELETRVPVPR